MKKFLFSALACAMLLPAVTVQADDREVVYYGSKTTIRGACKGITDRVCKRISEGGNDDGGIIDIPDIPPFDGELRPLFPSGAGSNPLGVSDDAQVIVECDGMVYECPASWVNWEDGSITPR